MRRIIFIGGVFKGLVLVAVLFLCSTGQAMVDDVRYCYDITSVPRDADGNTLRSQAVVKKFKAVHPCPKTKLSTGPCPEWQVNHVIPLAVGGCDTIFNLQWLPTAIKTCALPTCVDRFERIIYAPDFGKTGNK